MIDHAYEDEELARWYDVCNPWAACDVFYLDRVRSARAVLDVGCGTGLLLDRARAEGHTGRLCGLDPGRGMLAWARRKRTDVEWILGDLSTVPGWDREFDLAVMTGHAFQELVTDDELRTSLAAIRAALTDGGRFAFETRNPAARAWERWTPEHASEVTDGEGVRARVVHEVELPVVGDLVSFTTTLTVQGWDRPGVDRSTLRFLGAAALDGFLTEAGFVVEERYGDWACGPLTETSPEIVTVARRG